MISQDCDRRRARLLVAGGACVVLALALLLAAVTAADARPQGCVVVLDGATVDAATSALVRLQSGLQSDEPLNGGLQDVLALEELIDRLDGAARFGCEAQDGRPVAAATATW